MIRKYLFLLVVALPLVLGTKTVKSQGMNQNNYQAKWQQIDSLMGKERMQTAEKMVQELYTNAKANNNMVQALKAQLYLLRINDAYKENADSLNIIFAEKESRTSDFPANAIWSSIAAQLYWNYYQQNRWTILQRTKTANEVSNDFAFWDAAKFYDKVSRLYLASLSRSEDLKHIDITKYNAILAKGTNTEKLRPTLYDLLTFRAIGYFQNDEKDIVNPAYKFQINDANAFAPANEFINYAFTTKDSSSLQFQALKLYQQLMAFHAKDASPDALIDADLQRLQFVYNNATLPAKKKLYENALAAIVEKNAHNAAAAEAAYRLYTSQYEGDIQPRTYGRKIAAIPTKVANRDYITLKAKLEAISNQFPASEGGIHAQQKIIEITTSSLDIKTEETVLPNEPSKSLVTYRNTAKVYFRVYSLTQKDFATFNRYDQNNPVGKMLSQKPLKAWAETLPGTEDFDTHNTEIKIDGLPEGYYIVFASSKENFAQTDNLLTATKFQASHISVINISQSSKSKKSGYILDRKTGQPIANATVQLLKQVYNKITKQYDYQKSNSTTSAVDGSFQLATGENYASYQGIAVKHKDNELFLLDYISLDNYNTPVGKTFKSYFFTDRSIYRPGQTIYFKGLLFESDSLSRSNLAWPNITTEVTFYDANNQKIASQKLTSNEFGSVSGTFTAPENGLTGYMRIENEYGSTSISVEEYKRPKFNVQFDTLKAAYKLNETIHVKGKAQAYAGSNIDGAAVKYRVVRNTRFPYYWLSYRWGYPSSSAQQEILNGTTQTDVNGNFTIDFTALPDETVDKRTEPVFTYTIYADVTDINGETRSGTQSVQIGYHATQIVANIPEMATPQQADTLNITTQNLNGNFVAANVKMTITQLRTPEHLYRKRLWETPDQFAMSEADFKKYFPLDEYKDESKPENWQKENIVYEQAFITTEKGTVAIPEKTWNKTAYYEIAIVTKTNDGDTITDKHYLLVINNNSKTALPENTTLSGNTNAYEPGNTAAVKLLSGIGTLNWIQTEQVVGGKTLFSNRTSGDGVLTWERKVTEADRGGIALKWITVKENRVYEESTVIQVPWTNKDLNISWETHRDKLLPGEKETWTMVVRGNKKDKVAAEMVAALYDASLDALKPHSWNSLNLFPSVNTLYFNPLGFKESPGYSLAYINGTGVPDYDKQYDEISFVGSNGGYYSFAQPQLRNKTMLEVARAAPAPAASLAGQGGGIMTKAAAEDFADPSINYARPVVDKNELLTQPKKDQETIPVRTNLQETAFFYPQLKTDADGNVRIQFTIPEALTEWKLMAMAHTKDMASGYIEGKVKTQKDLMVVPGLPRFLRQGDDIVISTKINNLSGNDLTGKATLQILDAQTGRPLDLPFRINLNEKDFFAAKGQSAVASWNVHVPESLYEPVMIRISAKAGNFTDGEENTLPVVTNRMLVTETMPFWMNGNGSKEFHFEKLLHSDSSKTLAQHKLTVEYTANPAWYAIQALPYLMEFPYECAEQTFNRYYANALAAHILDQAPKVKAIFDTWQNTDTTALLSNLQKNQELKTALLEETPWVLDAQNETEQKHRIALLFETHKLNTGLNKALGKLNDMILPEGGFPWFKGMYPDRYITQYIATGIGRLQRLGATSEKGNAKAITDKTIPYLDLQIKNDYNELLKRKVKMQDQQIGTLEIQYLYMRSFFANKADASCQPAIDYYRKQAAKYWPAFNAYMKGMIAIALYRNGDKATANEIMLSLKETALHKEEMGMYWVQKDQSYWWYQAPVESQSLLIEAFTEVSKDTANVEEMKRWLLKQKQTQNWQTTKATADACYALLLNGPQWLSSDPVVTIKLGDKEITPAKEEAGTGYFKTNFSGKDIKPAMGNIQLNVSNAPNRNAPSWGAVYWQYFEQMDKISGAATPLSIRKQIFVERNTDRGPSLETITDGNALTVGDKVKVRIEITVDRDMEYVHLKDMRGSCFEPVNVLSGYRWENGLGYYESTKDISSNFFFSYLPKGKYVFEYPVFVTNKGNFSNGIATIQCMYAPEFSSHSEGIRVEVK